MKKLLTIVLIIGVILGTPACHIEQRNLIKVETPKSDSRIEIVEHYIVGGYSQYILRDKDTNCSYLHFRDAIIKLDEPNESARK